MSRRFSNKYGKVWEFEEGTVAVFLRDKLMLRNMQTLTVTVTIEWRRFWDDVTITIVATGGREGIFRLDFWAAENAAERWAEREINQALMRIDGGAQTTYRARSERPME
ncbi:MAG: hypothetical protein JSW61_09280 [Candidatus Thorarchaeota archaeon]|nr:MAG: hypothetical protein JSW61_09280 [Candidatus Thorarchaeota archaeon]